MRTLHITFLIEQGKYRYNKKSYLQNLSKRKIKDGVNNFKNYLIKDAKEKTLSLSYCDYKKYNNIQQLHPSYQDKFFNRFLVHFRFM